MKQAITISSIIRIGIFAAILAGPCGSAAENEAGVDQLVRQLGKTGAEGAQASAELVKIGGSAVPERCKALTAMDASVNRDEDANLLFGSIWTLAEIAKSAPATMQTSLPCLMRTARRTTNKNAKTFIVSSIRLFGPTSVPYLMAYLDAEMKNSPQDDPGTTVTQGLVGWAIINMAEENAKTLEAVLASFKRCLRDADAQHKPVIALQFANLSDLSPEVALALEEEMNRADDPELRKRLREVLDLVRKGDQK